MGQRDRGGASVRPFGCTALVAGDEPALFHPAKLVREAARLPAYGPRALRRSHSTARLQSKLGEHGGFVGPGRRRGVGPLAANRGGLGLLAYNSSKATLNAITLMYAGELRDEGVLVNAFSPGFAATDLNGHSGPLTVEQAAAVPVKAATLPDDGPTGRFLSRYGEAPW